ncbi:hypothetical protein MUK42_05553 [Musa troglodytarum]|uniref:Uncharacterized protein n=1 Tax=Musa troglodytarum TaxID=320322 RepID=A0A9E7EU45_9LILI|nr:hypothetical protein MUK42_05553 [Musa troglodytarum]
MAVMTRRESGARAANIRCTEVYECVPGANGCRRSGSRGRRRGSGSGRSRRRRWRPEPTTWRRCRSRASRRASTSPNWPPSSRDRPPRPPRTSKQQPRWRRPSCSVIPARELARVRSPA